MKIVWVRYISGESIKKKVQRNRKQRLERVCENIEERERERGVCVGGDKKRKRYSCFFASVWRRKTIFKLSI